jgi:type IV secretory pathway component VirB8
MLEERVQELEKKLDKEIKHNEALAKRVIGFMRKEREEMAKQDEKEEASKKKEVSCSKNEVTKDMVFRRSDGD